MVVDSGALRGIRHGFVTVLAVGSARCWPAPGCSPRSPSGPNTWPPHRAIRRSTAAPAPAGARQVVDQSLVEVVPVQVPCGGVYLDHPVADVQNTDIDGAATEAEDQHRLMLRRTRRNHHRRPAPSGGVRPCRASCPANASQTAGSQTATPRFAGAPRTAGPALPTGLPAILVTVDIDHTRPTAPYFPWNPLCVRAFRLHSVLATSPGQLGDPIPVSHAPSA
jgi:hypothetical protein